MVENYYSFVREQYGKFMELPEIDKDLALLDTIKPVLRGMEAELRPYDGISADLERDLEKQAYSAFLNKLDVCHDHLADLSDIIREISSKLDRFNTLVNSTDGNFFKKKLYRSQYRKMKEMEQKAQSFIQRSRQSSVAINLPYTIKDGEKVRNELDASLNGFHQAEQAWKKEMLKYGLIAAGVLTMIILIFVSPWFLLIPAALIGLFIYDKTN